MTENTEFQDQGALDQPEQQTPTAAEAPQDRIQDVPAGATEGGPVDPNLDQGNPEVDAPLLQPQEADPTAEADNTSASALAQVNEARESGQPLNEGAPSAVEQPAVTPGGTGTAAGATAGTVDT